MGERPSDDAPKAPRWVSTEAGQWAWAVDAEWRRSASAAMRISDRRRLLNKAEDMRQNSPATAA